MNYPMAFSKAISKLRARFEKEVKKAERKKKAKKLLQLSDTAEKIEQILEDEAHLWQELTSEIEHSANRLD